MSQIDAIFSSTLKCGEAKAATKWSDLGLDGSWSGKDLQLFGRNSCPVPTVTSRNTPCATVTSRAA
jgi:hypothetical protein